MYIHIHIPIYMSITCTVYIVLLVCMLSGLTTWYWKTNWHVLLWGRIFLPLSGFLIYL